MEIRLKTADEFRDAHVTIEIRATPDEVFQQGDDGGRLARVAADRARGGGELEAKLAQMRAERDAAERRINELMAERAGHCGTIEGQRDRNIDLQASIRSLESQVEKAQTGRQVNREWAERTEIRAKELADRLDNVAAAVFNQSVSLAIIPQADVPNRGVRLREAVLAVRDAVGRPLGVPLSPPEGPASTEAPDISHCA